MLTYILSLMLAFGNPQMPGLVSYDDMLFIQMEVNGQDAYFMVDTELPATVLDLNQAEAYGFYAVGSPRRTSGICGTDTWKPVSEARFRYEGRSIFPKLAGAKLHCLQRKYAKHIPGPILGILGNDMMENFPPVYHEPSCVSQNR